MKIKISFFIGIFILLSIRLFSQIDYFWVGGQGNWSNLNNWRTITGSIPSEVPDANDNVIFNEYSFPEGSDTVFVLTGNPTCKNMIWQNLIDTVYLFGGSATTTFSIYGSVTFDHFLVNNYTGKIRFLSDLPGNTITCSGVPFAGDIYFDGKGEWILQDTLLVFDTIRGWQAFFDDDPSAPPDPAPDKPNPVIIHNNGRLNGNNQTIVCRGFASSSNKTRELDFDNSNIYILGNWAISGQKITFNASNSYIKMLGQMSNVAGDTLFYHDIDFMFPEGAIKNTDIKTKFRKIHFFGSGTLDGKKTAGQEGSFIADTVLMEGAITMAGPIPCNIKGVFNNIHYTQVNLVDGHIDSDKSFYHRVDFNGYWDSDAKGKQEEMDSIFFNNFSAKGAIAGDHLINYIAYFTIDGIISSWPGYTSTVHHLYFNEDGIMSGNNSFDLLTMTKGYWYQMGHDSLTQPGSAYTNSIIQTVAQMEIVGGTDCYKGLTYLSTSYKSVQAILNYTGVPITLDYFMANYIKNTGTLITVENGLDLGHNDGFDFVNPLQGRALYWVGGDGDWNDPVHWSLTSGGAPGDQCPPTIVDNIFFDAGSGFTDSGMLVNVNVKYAMCNDMTWTDDIQNMPMLEGGDTSGFHIWGSVKLSTSMAYDFWGKLYYDSENDDQYETIDVGYTWPPDNTGTKVYDILSKSYWYGEGGKWVLLSNYTNYDTAFLNWGELKMVGDTFSTYNFQANDTLTKGLYLLDSPDPDGPKTLAIVHAWNQEAWILKAFGMTQDPPKTLFDADHSTVLSMGDWGVPMGQLPGYCNVRTTEGDTIVTYNNVQFNVPGMLAQKSKLISECQCSYNLVDYYCMNGDAFGTGFIDTITYKRAVDASGNVLSSADGCKIRNNYNINFLIAESYGDTIMGNQVIDTALFYDDGALFGYNNIGYMWAKKAMRMLFINTIDTCVLLGNAEILGTNTFSQLIISPNKRYYFQHDLPGYDYIQTINDDFIAEGFCDSPIRMQSDSIGTQATILYKMQNPTNTDFTVNYTSLRDINMSDYTGTPYVASNSVDLGNNTNWFWLNGSAEDDIYYWIGGNGDWSDWQHWSFTSGGAPIVDECTPRKSIP